MPDVITTAVLALASPKSIEYLNALFVERFDGTLDASMYEGKPQAEVSAMIQRLLKNDGTREASAEDLSKVEALAVQAGYRPGENFVVGATNVAVQRQIRDLSRKVNRAAYAKASADFDAFLTTLTADEAGELSSDIPF